jgi:hypothetical protein
MSISSVGAAPPQVHFPSRSEAAERRGPDHDGDADDAGTAAPAVRAPQPSPAEAGRLSMYL